MTDSSNTRIRFQRWLLAASLLAVMATTGCAAADGKTGTDEPADGYEQLSGDDKHTGKAQNRSDDDNEVTAVSLGMEQLALAPNESFELQPAWSPADAAGEDSVSYFSSDTGIASIDDTGKLTISANAITGDQALVTVQAGQAQATLTITVKTKLSETANPGSDDLLIVTNPTDYDVVVNKQRRLPDGFHPDDLVVPNVPFSFSGDSEKKKLRKQAALALEQLFAQAEEDGIALYAVSGFRSFGTQQAIFQYNVTQQGEEEARRYSAYPGTSEHQTGLAMDVSSPSVNNALDESLGETEEGKWLAEHAPAHGFIIRYPQGKEEITGYAYEPWHLRYVGKQVAKQMDEQGLTLEQYFAADRPNSN